MSLIVSGASFKRTDVNHLLSVIKPASMLSTVVCFVSRTFRKGRANWYIISSPASKNLPVTLQVTATDTTVKDLSTLNLEGAVETLLADDVVVGGTYNYNAAVAKPEEIYIKKAFDVKLGDLALDARYRLPTQVAALTATLRRNADYIRAAFNTDSVVERVEGSKRFSLPGERQLALTPAWDQSTRAFELTVAQDIQAGKTNAVLELSQADKDGKLTLNHQVDDANTISPTLSLKRGYLTYQWTHLLGDGAKLQTTLDPFTDLDVTWSDPGKGGEWVTRANIPLKEPRTATLSFKRKFTFQ